MRFLRKPRTMREMLDKFGAGVQEIWYGLAQRKLVVSTVCWRQGKIIELHHLPGVKIDSGEAK